MDRLLFVGKATVFILKASRYLGFSSRLVVFLIVFGFLCLLALNFSSLLLYHNIPVCLQDSSFLGYFLS